MEELRGKRALRSPWMHVCVALFTAARRLDMCSIYIVPTPFLGLCFIFMLEMQLNMVQAIQKILHSTVCCCTRRRGQRTEQASASSSAWVWCQSTDFTVCKGERGASKLLCTVCISGAGSNSELLGLHNDSDYTPDIGEAANSSKAYCESCTSN
jgi:hypothetical protein